MNVISSSLAPEQLQALTQLCSSRPPSRVSPPAFVRDLAVVGYSRGCSDQQILVFARKQVATRPGLATFLKQITPLRRVMATAKRCVVNSSPTAARSNSQRVARLLVGRLLSKIEKGTPSGVELDEDLDDVSWAAAIMEAPKANKKPVSPATQLRIRVALAVVGLDLLSSINSEAGWNTTQMSYARASQLTGWSASTSKKALSELVSMNLISELPTARKATARRFKMNRGLNPAQREVAATQYETIGALMDRPGAAIMTAALIQSVPHSAWNYGPSPLGHRAWWVAVCDSAGIDPTPSVSKRNVARDRKALRAAGLTAGMMNSELTAVLDAYSRESGGLEAKRASEEAYRVASAERTAEVLHWQSLKGDAKAIVEELGGTFEKIPKTHVYGGRKFARWIETMTEALTDREYPADLATAVHAELGRRIGGRMRDADAGKIVAGWITSGLRLEGGVPAKRTVQRTAARGLGHLVAGLPAIPAGSSDEFSQKVWLKELRGKMTGLPPMTAEMQTAIAVDLRTRLVLRGYESDRATKASTWCVRDVAIVEEAAAA